MFKMEPGQIEFDYVNWKNESRHRRAEIHGIHWGTSEYYPEPTWLADGIDLDRNVRRTYNMMNMKNVVHIQ